MCPSRSLALADVQQTSKSGLRSAFDTLDVDRDGRISKDDLKSFYAVNGVSRDDESLGSMMTFADSNNDGFVEYSEFTSAVKRSGGACRAPRGSVVEDMFNAMDFDGDGRLSHGDLKSFMKLARIDAGDDEVAEMISLAGHGSDGGVTVEEFVKILSLGNFYY